VFTCILKVVALFGGRDDLLQKAQSTPTAALPSPSLGFKVSEWRFFGKDTGFV
jgi:hypothetical protein